MTAQTIQAQPKHVHQGACVGLANPLAFSSLTVMPAKAGIQCLCPLGAHL